VADEPDPEPGEDCSRQVTLGELFAEAAHDGTSQVARAHHGPAARGDSGHDEDPNEVVEHLVLHKSLADHDPDRLGEYLEMARSDVASFRNPFDRAIALVFHLANDEHMDPWSIDLSNFSTRYVERIRETPEVDLITGGRLLSMAWNVLLRQTEGLLEREENDEPEGPEHEPWDMGFDQMPEDWGQVSEEEQYNQEVLDEDNDPPLSEQVHHQGDRRVTLFELVEALEEGRRNAQRRKRLEEERRKAREAMDEAEADEDEEVSNNVHEEDLEAEISHVRERLTNVPPEESIPIADLFDGTKGDYLTIFISTLFLSRARMVNVAQEEFPTGPIRLTPRQRLYDENAELIGLPADVDEDADADANDDTEETSHADATEEPVPA
jgi:chromatin segregation and condensation protein Rec8/ScpA/Scc1 (kleisin family)